jgi:hypothetical protein
MKASQRVTIISAVADALEPRGWAQADVVLEHFGVTPDSQDVGDLKIHIHRTLSKAPPTVLVDLAEHFGVQVEKPASDNGNAPIWEAGMFRMFISHLAADKVKATELSRALDQYGISSFVAHEDIHPSLEWQREIERALMTMDALVAMVTPDFPKSRWTDQEVGYALGRGLLVIPLQMGLDPYGFFGKHQAIKASGRKAHEVAASIYSALCTNPLTQERMADGAIEIFAESGSFRNAEANAEWLLKFSRLSPSQLKRVEDACIENMEIFASFGCPGLIERLYQKHRYRPAEIPEGWELTSNAER